MEVVEPETAILSVEIGLMELVAHNMVSAGMIQLIAVLDVKMDLAQGLLHLRPYHCHQPLLPQALLHLPGQ